MTGRTAVRQLLLIGALVGAMLLAGCFNAPPPPASTPPASTPPGFAPLSTVPIPTPVGTVLYHESGSVFGTVRGYDPKHRFSIGTPRPGVLVQWGNGRQNWMDLKVAGSQFFVKK